MRYWNITNNIFFFLAVLFTQNIYLLRIIKIKKYDVRNSFSTASANNVPTESSALAVKYWYYYASGRLKLLLLGLRESNCLQEPSVGGAILNLLVRETRAHRMSLSAPSKHQAGDISCAHYRHRRVMLSCCGKRHLSFLRTTSVTSNETQAGRRVRSGLSTSDSAVRVTSDAVREGWTACKLTSESRLHCRPQLSTLEFDVVGRFERLNVAWRCPRNFINAE